MKKNNDDKDGQTDRAMQESSGLRIWSEFKNENEMLWLFAIYSFE